MAVCFLRKAFCWFMKDPWWSELSISPPLWGCKDKAGLQSPGDRVHDLNNTLKGMFQHKCINLFNNQANWIVHMNGYGTGATSTLLWFNSFRICRLEKAADNQLSLAVDEGVCHVLFCRKTVGSLQWLDPVTTCHPVHLNVCQEEHGEAPFYDIYFLPYKMLDEFQLAVDCRCVFMNHRYMCLNIKAHFEWMIGLLLEWTRWNAWSGFQTDA